MLSSLLFTTACLLSTALSRPQVELDGLRYRDLKAAKSHGDLLQRSDSISLKKSITLTYAEDSSHGADGKTFSSRVRLGGDRPTLLLDEIDHLLEFVECSGSTMTLGFRDLTLLTKAKRACEELSGGLIVASHYSCSDAGAHNVFEVSDFEYDDVKTRIEVGIKETTWRKAFPSKKVEFGLTPESHVLNNHARLFRRQEEEPTAASRAISVASTLVPTGSATPTVDSVTFDLSNDQTETTFSWPAGIQIGPSLPITVGCKKCTTKGQLILTQGEIDLTDIDELTEQVFDTDKELDFIKSGFFQLELNGFESSILLKASPSASLSFAFDLFTVPVLGFRIPKFGSAGIMFNPQLTFDIGISGGVELTWGFKVNVPDHSTIRLDVGQFNNSGVTGFDKTTVEALPFGANTSDIELTLRAGLRPFVPLGVQFFDGRVTLQGGPYLDLPYINTTITQLATSNVNENCETGKGQQSDKFKGAFQNLTHISSEMGMAVGFEFEATLDTPGPGGIDKLYDYEIWNMSAQLPTSCLAFNKDRQMVAATAAAKSVNAASGRFAPSSELPAFLGPFGQYAILGLCAITTVFAVL